MKQFDTNTDDIQMSEDYKPTYINEQHNNNCQQFFGPIMNCTFTMPAASTKPDPKVAKPRKKAEQKPKTGGKPLTLKYYKHGNKGVLMKQRKRVDIVFRLWNKWGWIDDTTSPDDFDALFEGEPRHCNITWKANATILTILLQELLQQSYVEKQRGCSAKSLVKKQFRKTANSDRTRLDEDAEEKIRLTLLVLDISNPLPERRGSRGEEDVDESEAALKEVFSGQLRETKGV